MARSWRTSSGANPRLREQAGAQQLREGGGAGLVFSRVEAMALHCSGRTMCGPKPWPSSSPRQPPQPNAAPDAAGVPAGSSPITDRTGLTPLGTLRLASTSPPSPATATWERLR
jgi:hypothetical protein